MSETGITDYLYNHISLSKAFTSSIRLFKIRSHIETVFGNDLDLFVEVKKDKFVWFVFQAKVMEYTGAFKDLKAKPHKLPQWIKLKFHEIMFDSSAYYLLYSGNPNIKSRRNKGNIKFTDCIGQANYRELGLAVVELENIIAYKKSKGITRNSYLAHFFPNEVFSFRYFFCPGLKPNANQKYYSLEEITDNKIYEEIDIKDIKSFQENFDEKDIEKITVDKGQGRTRLVLKLSKQ